MFNSSQDILLIIIAASVLLLSILLAVAILYFIFILRDASKTTFYIRDTAKKINEVVYRPLVIVHSVLDKIQPILDSFRAKTEDLQEKDDSDDVKKKKKSKK